MKEREKIFFYFLKIYLREQEHEQGEGWKETERENADSSVSAEFNTDRA